MWVRLLSVTMLLLGLMLLVCKLPSPPPGPENAFVAMEFKNSSGVVTKEVMTDSIGKKFHICLIHNLTQYVDSSVLIITKGSNIQEVISIRSFKGQVDTTYYPVLFSDTGIYTVSFTSYIEGKTTELKGKINIVGQPLTTQNQKPVLTVSKEIMTGAGQELVIPVSATDPDTNQQVTITVTGKPESATFTDNLFKWTPGLADTGSVTVTFTATDNGLPVLSVTDSCVIVVSATPVNRAPQWSITSMQRSTLPEVLFSLDVSSYCIDPDNDNLTFSLLTQAPAKDTIAGNLYQFTPAVTDTGLHSISIVASDPAGLTDTLFLELTILVPGSTSKPDIAPPVIIFRSPSKDTVISVDSCEIKVTCVDDSGCAVLGYIDETAFTMVKVQSVPNLWTGLVKGLKTGINSTIKIIATDSSAAKNADSAFVKVQWSKKTTFALTIKSENGSVSKSPDAQSYDSGTVVTLTPIPSNNYHFTGWSGDLTGSTNPATVIINSTKTVTAGFEVNPPSTFALTVVASNGAVKKTPDLSMYDSGSTVGLKATAATGYHFVKWTGDASGTTDTIAVQMSTAKSLTANFEIDSYQLTLSAGTGGSISLPASSPAAVNYNVATSITAVASEGFNFSGWTSSGPATITDPSSPSTKVVLTGNATVTANFTQKSYPLTVAAGTGGKLTAPVSSPVTVNHGVPTTITAVADDGYDFSGWTVSGTTAVVAVSTSASTTVILTGTATVTANFSIKNFPPVMTDTAVTTNEDIAVTINLSGLDKNGTALTGWSITKQPSQGTVSLTTNKATYTPAANFSGKDTFNFRASDGSLFDTGSIFITVNPVNDAPSLSRNTTITVLEGSNGTVNTTRLDFTDPDNQTSALDITITAIPKNGQLTLSGVPLQINSSLTYADLTSPGIIYTHNGSETLSDEFSFKVSDGALSVNGVYKFTIAAVNDVPVLSKSGAQMKSACGIGNTYYDTINVTDAEGAYSSMTITMVPSDAKAVINSTGRIIISWLADYNRYSYNQSVDFTLKLADGTNNLSIDWQMNIGRHIWTKIASSDLLDPYMQVFAAYDSTKFYTGASDGTIYSWTAGNNTPKSIGNVSIVFPNIMFCNGPRLFFGSNMSGEFYSFNTSSNSQDVHFAGFGFPADMFQSDGGTQFYSIYSPFKGSGSLNDSNYLCQNQTKVFALDTNGTTTVQWGAASSTHIFLSKSRQDNSGNVYGTIARLTSPLPNTSSYSELNVNLYGTSSIRIFTDKNNADTIYTFGDGVNPIRRIVNYNTTVAPSVSQPLSVTPAPDPNEVFGGIAEMLSGSVGWYFADGATKTLYFTRDGFASTNLEVFEDGFEPSKVILAGDKKAVYVIGNSGIFRY